MSYTWTYVSGYYTNENNRSNAYVGDTDVETD